mgnify:CR=1 FL=1
MDMARIVVITRVCINLTSKWYIVDFPTTQPWFREHAFCKIGELLKVCFIFMTHECSAYALSMILPSTTLQWHIPHPSKTYSWRIHGYLHMTIYIFPFHVAQWILIIRQIAWEFIYIPRAPNDIDLQHYKTIIVFNSRKFKHQALESIHKTIISHN